jgi:hypothetical protein
VIYFLELKALGELLIKDKSGHIEHSLSWDSTEPQTLIPAAETFKTYRQKGWLPIGKSVSGDWKHIFSFDPSLQQIIFMPLMEGG